MKRGFLFVLVFWAATELARAQAPYPGPYPNYMGPGPMYPQGGPVPGYPGGGMMPYPGGGYPYAYPQPYPYYPQGTAAEPYIVNPKSAAKPAPTNPPAQPIVPVALQCSSEFPVVPTVPPLAVTQENFCEPMLITKLSCPSCKDLFKDRPTPQPDCLQNPNQAGGNYCFYGRAEVLYWWMQNQSVAGLTSTGNISGSTVSVGGISFDLSSVIPDYNYITDANQFGLRFTLGFFLDQENLWAVEGNVFAVLSSPTPYYATGGPTVAVPASAISSLSSLLGLSVAQTTSLLNGLSTTNVVATVGVFGGAELNLRHEFISLECGHIGWLAGARVLELVEYGGVVDSFGSVVVGTWNQYVGGQIGLEGELNFGRFYLDGVGKIGLGVNQEQVSVGTTASAPTNLSSFIGNQGTQTRDVLAGVGEVGVTAGIRIGCNARLFANYTLIYLTDAVRPLPQVAPYLGGATPAFNYNSSSFWAQGASVGFELRF